MRLLVLNPNTSEAMTAEIAAAARAVAAADTEIVARCPRFGATAIDSAAESYLSAVGVMDLVATMVASGEFDYDAVILAGFGEHGKDALQEMLTVPVLDIAEAAAHVAHLIGRRFSVVTTLARSIPPIEDRLMLAGLGPKKIGSRRGRARPHCAVSHPRRDRCRGARRPRQWR